MTRSRLSVYVKWYYLLLMVVRSAAHVIEQARPSLQRDFLRHLPSELSVYILKLLDIPSLLLIKSVRTRLVL
jgi:hypothetical protein